MICYNMGFTFVVFSFFQIGNDTKANVTCACYNYNGTGMGFSLTPFCSVSIKKRNDGNILFNDTLSTFYLRLYGITHMVKDHSDSERGNLLLPHGLLFLISSNGSFICTIQQTGNTYHNLCYTNSGALTGC